MSSVPSPPKLHCHEIFNCIQITATQNTLAFSTRATKLAIHLILLLYSKQNLGQNIYIRNTFLLRRLNDYFLFTCSEACSITKRECYCVREVPLPNNILCQFNPVPTSSYLVSPRHILILSLLFKRKMVIFPSPFSTTIWSQVPFPSCVLYGQAT